MRKRSILFGVLTMSVMMLVSGCSGELARRSDGTCVFVCDGAG